MATSSSTDFDLDVADYIEEAFERCGLEFRTGYDAVTARRSLNFLFADWANRGLNRWTMDQVSQPVVSGLAEYPVGTTIAADLSVEDVRATIDILSAVIRRSGTDVSISRVSRDTFLNIPNKTTTGRPTQYYVDRQITPVLKIWPTPENSTDIFIYDRLVRIDDADTSANTVGIPFRFYPCLAAGLAYYIALKRSPDRVQLLKGLYEEEFIRAADEDRDKVSINLVPSYTFVSAVS